MTEKTVRSLSTLRISIADMVVLNVRTKGRKNPELPEVLYQNLPERAMSLMSTIPYGTFAVSIPGSIGPRRLYPILKTLPSAPDGFLVLYGRKPNARYEAVSVRYQGKNFEISQFVGIAQRLVKQYSGRPRAIADSYACFAPDPEAWGVILRDNGYAAWDPISLASDPAPEPQNLRLVRHEGAVVVRVPLYAGQKGQQQDLIPAFARVEIALDSGLGQPSRWIRFEEYQRFRALQSRPPDSIISDFHEWLTRLTEDCGFRCWVFRPGMSFGDRIEWWGDGCRRRTEHEGFDFVEGIGPGASMRGLPEGTSVRSIAEGVAVALLDDFLGKTIVVRHPAFTRPNGDVFHTFLSHIQPLIKGPGPVARGGLLGHVGKSTNSGVPAHLHMTGAWFPEAVAASGIRMDHIHPGFAPVSLADFSALMRRSPLCRWD
jgi:hypothetical protein